MAIQVPNFGSAEGGGQQARMTNDGVKPWLALSEVGNQGRKFAQDLHDHNMKIQEVENAADLAEFKSAAQSAYANRKLSFAEDHDYSSYKDKWERDLTNLEGQLEKSNMSQSTRESARLYLEQFKGGSRIGVAGIVQQRALERGKQAYANQMTFIRENYDPSAGAEGRTAAYSAIDDATWMTPEQKEAQRMEFDKYADKQGDLAWMVDDPSGYLEAHKEPGADTAEWMANQRKANAILTQRQSEQADDVLNRLYGGQIVSIDDVKALTPDIDDYGRAKLVEAINDKAGEITKTKILTDPAYYNQVVGEISRGINSYNPEVRGFDAEYVSIRSKIDALPTGALKSEYIKALNDVREGRQREIKTVRDWAFKQIDEAASAGQYGKVTATKPKGRSLGSYLDDGLLRNRDTLISYGFTQDQANAIATLEETGKRTEAIDKLQTLWSVSNAKEEGFPADLDAAFQAIRDHKGSSAAVITESARLEYEAEKGRQENEARRKEGAAVRQLTEYLDLNPGASMDEVMKALEDIDVDVSAGETDGTWLKTFSQYKKEKGFEDFTVEGKPTEKTMVPKPKSVKPVEVNDEPSLFTEEPEDTSVPFVAPPPPEVDWNSIRIEGEGEGDSLLPRIE